MSKAATPEGTARRAAILKAARSKGGRFVSYAEQRRRMNIIESLYLRGERNGEQVAARLAAGITFDDGSVLKLSRSRTLVYIKRLRERWSTEAEADRRRLLGEWRKSVLVDLSLARSNKQFGPVASMHRRLAEVDGLVGPVRYDVTVRAGDAATAASLLAGWTAEQVKHYAETGEEPADDESGGPST